MRTLVGVPLVKSHTNNIAAIGPCYEEAPLLVDIKAGDERRMLERGAPLFSALKIPNDDRFVLGRRDGSLAVCKKSDSGDDSGVF